MNSKLYLIQEANQAINKNFVTKTISLMFKEAILQNIRREL